MTETVLAIIGILALGMSSFCSGVETGLLSVSRGRILHMAREGGRRARVIHAAIVDLQRSLTTILIGNNIANVVISSVSAALADSLLSGSAIGRAVWGMTVAMVMLIIGEFMPKLLFSARPLRRLLAMSAAWRFFNRLLGPLGAGAYAMIKRMLPRREARVKVTPEAVLDILQDRKDGVRLSEIECALISRIMVLRAKGAKVTPESLLEAI